jgi:UDP-N-acetylglucosamine--N-acetylmuramyl-(pentapeptide) pyrophosphoryl-undecaprenol N-acetylglucosamine transferase
MDRDREPVRVAIGAGGTGGHIYPGLAVAAALDRLTGGRAEVEFHGVRGRLEEQLVPAAGHALFLTAAKGFGTAPAAEVAARLWRATARCTARLRAAETQVVLGMGGYPSLPVVLAARRLGLPLVVHESNAVPGLANRVAMRLTRQVALAHPADRVRRGARVIGMPMLPEIAGLDRAALREPARRTLGVGRGQRLVVVSGGSLGARRLTDAAIELAERWAGRDDVRVIVKTGEADLARATALLAGSPVATPVAYLNRMDLVYAAADAMVTRAGAATVAELPVAGVPAVLVPLPGAPGDHQRHNAAALARTGGAVVVEDAALDGARLAAELTSLLDPETGRRMRSAAAPLARRDAAERLAAWALDIAGAAGAITTKEHSA